MCSKPEAGLPVSPARSAIMSGASGALSMEFLDHFTDSSRNGVLRGALGSSLGGSFLVPRITYFGRFGQEVQKRETGSIESGGDPRGGPRGSQVRNGDFRNSQVSLKFTCFSLSV